MAFIISELVPELGVEGKFSEQEKKFALLIQLDSVPYILLEGARSSLGIPPTGYNITLPIQSYYIDGSFPMPSEKEIDLAVEKISRFYGRLPTSWHSSIRNLIFYNILTPPDKQNYPPFIVRDLGDEVVIRVREKISFAKLKELSKEALSKLPGLPDVGGNLKSIDRFARLTTLRNEEQSDFGVTERLNEEGVENFGIQEGEYSKVANYVGRVKKMISKHIPQDWQSVLVTILVDRNKT